MMVYGAELEPETLTSIAIRRCCGPAGDGWPEDRRVWVCEYHDGYDTAMAVCKDAR